MINGFVISQHGVYVYINDLLYTSDLAFFVTDGQLIIHNFKVGI